MEYLLDRLESYQTSTDVLPTLEVLKSIEPIVPLHTLTDICQAMADHTIVTENLVCSTVFLKTEFERVHCFLLVALGTIDKSIFNCLLRQEWITELHSALEFAFKSKQIQSATIADQQMERETGDSIQANDLVNNSTLTLLSELLLVQEPSIDELGIFTASFLENLVTNVSHEVKEPTIHLISILWYYHTLKRLPFTFRSTFLRDELIPTLNRESNQTWVYYIGLMLEELLDDFFYRNDLQVLFDIVQRISLASDGQVKIVYVQLCVELMRGYEDFRKAGRACMLELQRSLNGDLVLERLVLRGIEVSK